LSESIDSHGRVLIRMPACYVGLLADVLEEKGIEMRLRSRDVGTHDLHVRPPAVLGDPLSAGARLISPGVLLGYLNALRQLLGDEHDDGGR
jgi:hypothetical protein